MSAADVPEWLSTLLRAAASVDSDLLARFRPPAGGGRAAAVLLLFGAGPAGPEILLIERAETLRAHAGQPAFPGGRVDHGDVGPAHTALREAAEEVGLDPAGVRVVGVLPDLYLAVTGFVVTPVVGWWHTRSAVGVADPAEVARVEAVPVAELVDPANRCQIRHPSGWVGPAFTVRGMTVWGFTAVLLDQVLELGGWNVPWDRADIRDLPPRTLDLAERSGGGGAGGGGGADRGEPAGDPIAPYEPDELAPASRPPADPSLAPDAAAAGEPAAERATDPERPPGPDKAAGDDRPAG